MQGSTVDSTQAAISAAGAAEHSEHPDLRLFGFIVFLVSESMLFVGLFVAYLTFKAMNPEWPPEGTPRLELLLPGINTIILVSSSFVAHKADEAIKHGGDVAGVRKWFGITMAMGIVFLCGQLYEYSNLEFGLTTNVFASTFYVLTGFHGLHVFVGVFLMGGVYGDRANRATIRQRLILVSKRLKSIGTSSMSFGSFCFRFSIFFTKFATLPDWLVLNTLTFNRYVSLQASIN